MPLPIPNLDDRAFADLVGEGRAMIPRLAPQWTNHNPSDPGITLLELLAFLTESALYDLNQVRDESYRAFLQLVGSAAQPGESLEAAVSRAVRALGTRSRAASGDDFEALALDLAEGRAARARLIPDFDLERLAGPAEGHVSLVVLPAAGTIGLSDPNARSCSALNDAMTRPATRTLLADLRRVLGERLLVTTILHVVAPEFAHITIRARVVGRRDARPTVLAAAAEAALRRYLDPYQGGDDGRGWPFGRAVYKSELHQQLEAVTGVDHVAELVVNDDASDNPALIGVQQLVCVGLVAVSVEIGAGP
jgi:hypothetical protein